MASTTKIETHSIASDTTQYRQENQVLTTHFRSYINQHFAEYRPIYALKSECLIELKFYVS